MGTIGIMEPESFEKKDFAGVSAYVNDSNTISAPITGIEGGLFPTPDRENGVQVLASEGTWTAIDNGFIQQLTGITNSTTPYITFTMSINGKPEIIEERTGLLTTGIYNWVSQPSIVRKGDVVKTTHDGGGTHITNQVLFMPIKS